MNIKLTYLLCFIILLSCSKKEETKTTEITTFKGQQVTGVTVSEGGRIFANFPRWRKDVKNSVIEVTDQNESRAYPNQKWNNWKIGETVKDSIFIAVQSVVAFENNLYVLDTRNPLFKGVINAPRVFVFNLKTDKLKKIYTLSENSYFNNSYINDLRVDKKHDKIYFTDSGKAGLVILDLKTGKSRRVLNEHKSTLSEQNFLTFKEGKWENNVHSDGIALDQKNSMLYYHALTGYNLYAISTDVLNNGTQEELEKNVKFIAKTTAPDGMIFDKKGNLYLSDLENNRIMKFIPKSKKLSIILEGSKVKWADTFSIHNNELYYTNSRINEAKEDISSMNFSINKIKLDK